MTEISSISGSHKLTSQLKVSMESVQKHSQIESTKTEEVKGEFQLQLDQLERGLKLANEIRTALEASLRDLG